MGKDLPSFLNSCYTRFTSFCNFTLKKKAKLKTGKNLTENPLFYVHAYHIWAMSWENLFMPNETNKGADQPAHPHSLISAFVVPCLDSITPLVVIFDISRLYLACVSAGFALGFFFLSPPHSPVLYFCANFFKFGPLFATFSQVTLIQWYK